VDWYAVEASPVSLYKFHASFPSGTVKVIENKEGRDYRRRADFQLVEKNNEAFMWLCGYTSHPAKSQKIEDVHFDSQRRYRNDGEFETGSRCGREPTGTFVPA
jgi:hypothetical protein